MKAVCVLFFAIVLCGCDQVREDTAEKTIVRVTVVPAGVSDIPQNVMAPASIFPREQASVSARLIAPIRELRAHKGDTVRAGDVLAILENQDLTAQYQEARAVLSDAEANLHKTESGTVPTDVERARGQVETASAALDQAQKNYDRRRRLFEQGAIPQKDLLQTETELATAKTNFEVTRKSLDLLQQQSSTGDVAMAKSKVEQARARLSASTANLGYTKVRSPFQGIVTDQFQYAGDMAGPATPIYTIMDLAVETAHVQVPEQSAESVQRGQVCTFIAGDSAIPNVNGKITVVNRALDPARCTVEVWCEIISPPADLRAGAFGSVSIETNRIRQAIVIPLSAVQIDEGTNVGVVFVVDQKQIAHRREVQIGIRQQNQIQIRSGITEGEAVVTDGNYALPDGTQVRIRENTPGQKQ